MNINITLKLMGPGNRETYIQEIHIFEIPKNIYKYLKENGQSFWNGFLNIQTAVGLFKNDNELSDISTYYFSCNIGTFF